MAINTGQSTDLVAIGTSDTTLLSTAAGESKELYVLEFHNTSGTTVTIELFYSSDATSSSSERCNAVVLTGGETARTDPICLSPSNYLIGKGDATGVNFHGIYTKRTGTDL